MYFHIKLFTPQRMNLRQRHFQLLPSQSLGPLSQMLVPPPVIHTGDVERLTIC